MKRIFAVALLLMSLASATLSEGDAFGLEQSLSGPLSLAEGPGQIPPSPGIPGEPDSGSVVA
jgi:hypothetical protein